MEPSLFQSKPPLSDSEDSGDDTNMGDTRGGSADPNAELVERVLESHKKDPLDWYTILGVSDTCSTEEAHQAYRKLALAVHPDKNKNPHATEAFRVVETAAKALKAGDDYKGADERPLAEDPVITPETLKPTESQKAIYQKATPLVQQMLKTKTDQHSNIIRQLDKLNREIYKRNKAEHPTAGSLQLEYGKIELATFSMYCTMHQDYQHILAGDPTTLTGSEKEKWRLAKEKLPQIGPTLDKFNREKGYPLEWNWPRAEYPHLFGGKSPSPSKAGEAFPKLKPGYTLTGEKIMAMLPKGRNGYQFIVKDEEENTIELVSGTEIGRRATNSYLSLPKDQIVNATKTETRYSENDAKYFDSVKDFAVKAFNTRSSEEPRHPNGYALVGFIDGTEHILSRTALRKVLGVTDADFEIQECEKRKGKIPAWKIKPLAWTEPRSMTIEKPTARRRRREANLLEDGGSAAGEGLFVPQGRVSGQRGRNISRSNFHTTGGKERSMSRATPADTISDLQSGMEAMRSEMAELKAMLRALTVNAN